MFLALSHTNSAGDASLIPGSQKGRRFEPSLFTVLIKGRVTPPCLQEDRLPGANLWPLGLLAGVSPHDSWEDRLLRGRYFCRTRDTRAALDTTPHGALWDADVDRVCRSGQPPPRFRLLVGESQLCCPLTLQWARGTSVLLSALPFIIC